MGDISLSKVQQILSTTSEEIEHFKDFLIAKPVDDEAHEYFDVIHEQLSHLLGSLEESKGALLELENVTSSPVHLNLDPILLQRLLDTIGFIIDKTKQEKTGTLIVALNALQDFQGILRNVGSKNTDWLKRGKRAEKVDHDRLEE